MAAIGTLPVLFSTGDHASRPSASAVGKGGLYSCTTHSLVYQTDGSSWSTWATLGSSGTVATDAIWDAAGDLAVGSGSNTAAKLTLGAAGGAVSRVNGAVAWNSGTSFPTAATGDRYWRTDLGEEYYYDGTRWLSTTVSRLALGTFQNISTSATVDMSVEAADGDVWLIAMYASFYTVTTLDGSKFWNLELFKYDAGSGTSLGSVTNQSGAANTYIRKKLTIGALLGTGMDNLNLSASKTSTPGNLYGGAHITYRTVAT